MFSRTLIISPHCDDETIGCGGLISSLSNKGYEVKVLIVATHKNTFNYSVNRVVSNGERIFETERALKRLGLDYDDPYDRPIYQLNGFEDGRLDMCSKKDLISAIDEHVREFRPTAVLFPYSSHHQDHQAVYQASIAALRPTVDTNYIRIKAAYEYPYITTSWNSNMRSDSKIYYPLTKEDIERKRLALQEYKTQLVRDPRDILDISSILNLARVRGTEIGYEYAEAFYPISIII